MRRGRDAAVWFAAWALGHGAGCGRSDQHRAPALEAALPDGHVDRAIAFAGCVRVAAGPVCHLADDRDLRWWVAEGPPVQVRSQGTVLPLPAGTPVAGGVLRHLHIPLESTWIEVGEPGSRRPLLRLELRPAVEHPLLARARRLREMGQAAAAEELLRAPSARELSTEDQQRAAAFLARLTLARGHPAEAERGLRDSQEKARAAGRVSEAVDDACTRAFILAVHEQRFADARAVLDEIGPLANDYPEGQARLPYFAGVIHASSGNARAALRDYRVALDRAARLGMTRDEAAARQQVAETMARLGRVDEALMIQRQVVEAAAATNSPCLRADPLIALSWYAVHADQEARREGRWRGAAPGEASENAAAALRRARAALAGCSEALLLQVASTNEALHALQRGDLVGARARIRKLKALPGHRGQDLAVWEAELEARIAVADGASARGLKLFRQQEALARTSLDQDGLFRAQVGQGQALSAQGRAAAAAAAYEKAEATLASALAAVPLGEGKETFAGLRGDSARSLVTALLDSGDAAGALRAVRSARSRVLGKRLRPQRIEQLSGGRRAEWEALVARYARARRELDAKAAAARWLSTREREAEQPVLHRLRREVSTLADELTHLLESGTVGNHGSPRPPEPGEVVIAYFPLERGWVGLAATPAKTQARALGAVEPDAPAAELAERLLAPFTDLLLQAKAVRLLPFGVLDAVDFQALPFRGAPLGEQLPVAFGLDLARDPAGSPRSERGSQPRAPGPALLVADPDRTLPDAHVEAGVVRTLLAAHGFVVQSLVGERATRAAILNDLPAAGLLHFAGHGRFGGRDGVDSALTAAAGERILLGDLVTLPRVPEVVTISACEGARSGSRSAGADAPSGWGIGQAFLVAGAEVVVAPDRPVLDAVALSFFRAFYQAVSPPEPGGSMAAVVARAAQSARRACRTAALAGASSFRVLVP